MMRWPRMTVRQYVMGIAILAFNIAVLGACWREMSRDSYETRVLGGIAALACFSYFWLPIYSACQPVESSSRVLWTTAVLGGSGFVFGGFFAVQNGHPWQWPGAMFGLAVLVPVFSASLGYLISRRRARLQHGAEQV